MNFSKKMATHTHIFDMLEYTVDVYLVKSWLLRKFIQSVTSTHAPRPLPRKRFAHKLISLSFWDSIIWFISDLWELAQTPLGLLICPGCGKIFETYFLFQCVNTLRVVLSIRIHLLCLLFQIFGAQESAKPRLVWWGLAWQHQRCNGNWRSDWKHFQGCCQGSRQQQQPLPEK